MTVIVCPPFLCLYTGFEKFLDCAVNLQFRQICVWNRSAVIRNNIILLQIVYLEKSDMVFIGCRRFRQSAPPAGDLCPGPGRL